MSKKIIMMVTLGLILALMLLVPGCSNNDMENEETTLLLTHNLPLEWAGKERAGVWYMFMEVAFAAVMNNEFDNVILYYGPEAVDLIAEGYQDTRELPDFLQEKFGGATNLAAASQILVDEYGVIIYASEESIGQHEVTPAAFVTPLGTAGFAKVLGEVDEVAAY